MMNNKNSVLNYFRKTGLIMIIFFGTCFILACGGLQARHTSSMIDYLYPGKENINETPSTPTFHTPVKVGIAFVPPTSDSAYRGPKAQYFILDEKQKMELMDKILMASKKYPFIASMEKIPSPYLVPKGGFKNLDQISAMYGVDVMVLLSYEQVQHTDEDLLSIAYWTVVGAYVFKGEKNDTSTMVDAVVYHIPTRKMLFRAAGTSQISAASTFVNLSEQLRKNSYAGFEQAIDDCVMNLESQLDQFRKKMAESPSEYKVLPSK